MKIENFDYFNSISNSPSMQSHKRIDANDFDIDFTQSIPTTSISDPKRLTEAPTCVSITVVFCTY